MLIKNMQMFSMISMAHSKMENMNLLAGSGEAQFKLICANTVTRLLQICQEKNYPKDYHAVLTGLSSLYGNPQVTENCQDHFLGYDIKQ